MKYASHIQIALLSLIIIFSAHTISQKLALNPRTQTASGEAATPVALGPYSYSGTLVDLGSGADVDNLETQGNGGMTVAFWITTNSSAASGIISKGMAANLSGAWQINRGTQTTPNRIVFQKEGATDLTAMRNNAIPVGVRTHFVITYDGSMLRSGVKIYANGTLMPDLGGGADGAVANSDAASTLILGGGPAVTSLDGTLEDVRIYNRILDSTEVAALAGVTVNPTPGPTIVNGSCSSTVNMCSAGTLLDQTDTSSANLWQCVGSNGGTTASCSTPIVQAVVTPVNGIYTVNAIGGTNVFKTIKECAAVVKAGETCLVQAGNYPERITYLPNSAVAGSPITFKASGVVVMKGFELNSRGYIVIDGFEVTGTALNESGIVLNTAPGSKVTNNYVHDTTGNAHGIALKTVDNVEISNNRTTRTGATGIRVSADATTVSKNVHVFGNNISWAGYLGNNKMSGMPGLQPSGSRVLVENNDMSHVTDFITFGFSDHVVIRNNLFHDVVVADTDLGPHIDGVQGWGNYTLIENNKMYNIHESGGNAHFTLFANDGAPRYGWIDSADAIVRHNTVNDIDSAFIIVQYNFKGAKVYSNTAKSINGLANGVVAAYTETSPNGKILNNIFSDAVGRDRLSSYYFHTASFPNAEVDYNLNWKPSCGSTCAWDINKSPYLAPPGSDTHAILTKDPLLLGSGIAGFTLSSNSPAIDKGGPLTKVATGDAGNGTTLIVGDAGMFQDGWAGVNPDWIAVGTVGNVAQISSINYTTNTITLTSSISRKVGDPVYLYKDTTGRVVLLGNAPDMGANESPYSSGTVTEPTYVPGDFNKDGYVNSLDFSAMSGAWNTSNTLYDLNKDGTVNTLDYSIMVRNWTT